MHYGHELEASSLPSNGDPLGVGKPPNTSNPLKPFSPGEERYTPSLNVGGMQDASRETVTLRHNSTQRALPLRQHASFFPGAGVGGAGGDDFGILGGLLDARNLGDTRKRKRAHRTTKGFFAPVAQES